MPRGKLLLLVGLIGSFILSGRPLFGASRFNIVNAVPSGTESDFQFLYGSQGLFRLEWQAGTQVDLAYRPLDGTTRRIMDRLLVQHFFGGVGLTDWFSLGIDFPVAWLAHFQDPTPAAAPGFSNELDLVDPRLDMKFEILSRYRHPVGIAFVPFVNLPLGNENHFLGYETVVGGGMLALDWVPQNRLLFGMNAGVDLKEQIDFRNVNLGTYGLRLGGGGRWRLLE